MVNPHPKVPNAPKCGDFGGRNKAGEPCGKPVIGGTRRCDMHSGKRRVTAKAEGAVVVELRAWGLSGHAELADPGETLLRLVTQSAARCELYARLLAEAFDAAERLRRSGVAPQSNLLDEETARMDLERIFNTGGVSALIGHKYAGTQTSGVIATGEAIRGLAELEATERDRCANFAAKAVAAGLAERMVRASEQMAGLLAAAVERTLARLGLDPKSVQVRSAVAEELLSLSTDRVIEGTAA
jgi:hypothetical protein